ncbi:MAG: hypothetical protein WB761_13030 [Solirubrobacteraceae bacterium]
MLPRSTDDAELLQVMRRYGRLGSGGMSTRAALSNEVVMCGRGVPGSIARAWRALGPVPA